MLKGGGVSADAIRAAFSETEYEFGDIVRKAFEKSPHLATVGACSVSCLITSNALWVANVGDCRAVLGQVLFTPRFLSLVGLQPQVFNRYPVFFLSIFVTRFDALRKEVWNAELYSCQWTTILQIQFTGKSMLQNILMMLTLLWKRGDFTKSKGSSQ